MFRPFVEKPRRCGASLGKPPLTSHTAQNPRRRASSLPPPPGCLQSKSSLCQPCGPLSLSLARRAAGADGTRARLSPCAGRVAGPRRAADHEQGMLPVRRQAPGASPDIYGTQRLRGIVICCMRGNTHTHTHTDTDTNKKPSERCSSHLASLEPGSATGRLCGAPRTRDCSAR